MKAMINQNLAIMKHIITLIALAALSVSTMNAQISKEQRKERQELLKMAKKDLGARATKTARKEAKRMRKEGWKTTPGALPIEKQLDKAYMIQMEYTADLFPKYITGEAMSVGENYDAAKMQALELAKQNLAGQIQTEMTALLENTVANKQLSAEQAASITETVMASKNMISQSLGRVLPLVEVYRVLGNKNKEVLVRIAYSADAAKEAVRKTLEEKADGLHDQLDKLLFNHSK